MSPITLPTDSSRLLFAVRKHPSPRIAGSAADVLGVGKAGVQGGHRQTMMCVRNLEGMGFSVTPHKIHPKTATLP